MSGAIETGCKKRGGDGNAGLRRWFPAECGFPPRNDRRWGRRDFSRRTPDAARLRSVIGWRQPFCGPYFPVSARKPACNRYATHTNGRRVSGWMTICRGTEAALRRPAEPWDLHAVLQAGKQRPLRETCCRYGFLRGRGYSHSTKPNQFCLEIILCRIRGAFDYLMYPYYPAYMG